MKKKKKTIWMCLLNVFLRKKKNYQHVSFTIKRKPIFAFQWHITDECDQRCKHCYIDHRNQKIMRIEDCSKVLQQVKEFCKVYQRDPLLVIAGGDPILFKDFDKFLMQIKEQSIPFTILGNPFHITAQVVKKLKDAGCVAYQMSLDGLRETHNLIRKKDSFDETIKAIKILSENGMKVSIMNTVSLLNYKELPDLLEFCLNETTMDSFAFARYCPSDSDDAQTNNVSPREYHELLKKVWDILKDDQQKRKRFYFKDHLWKLFFYELGTFKPEKTKRIISGCNCAYNHLTLLPNGDLFACRRFESKIGNVFENKMSKVFLSQNSKYRELQQKEGCKDCELLMYCRGCPAVSYGTYGDFYAKDPQCWKYIEKTKF